MWACQVEVVLALRRFEVHEDMMALGSLTNMWELSEPSRRCIFMSQTWLSFKHPDPDGVKFRLLRELLSNMDSCSIEFPMHWHEQLFSGYSCLTKEQAMEHVKNGHVWMDYWSVPQRDPVKQQAYVDSVFVYVQMCSLFVALVPPCQHRDTGEMMDITRWEERGWCRLESISNVLAERPAPLLVVESLGNRWLGSNHWLIKPVGQGSFTCCELNHILPNGQKIQCDKGRIARTLEKLFDFKIKKADEDDDMFTYRLIQCFREHLLGGLSVQRPRDTTLVEWMERFRFFTPFACASDGWTPLRYAVYEGRVDIAAQLLEMNVDLESPLTSDFCEQVFFHREGMTILHGAAMVQRSPEVLRFLIDKAADVNRTFGRGFTTALASAIGSAADNFQALVDAGCATIGEDLLTAVQSDPKMLPVCVQKCPELFGAHGVRQSPNCASQRPDTRCCIVEVEQAAPMWACRVDAVQTLRRFEVHEDMMGLGSLENMWELSQEVRKCIFLSQNWLSYDHPDPKGVKFRLLRKLLEAMSSCSIEFPMHWHEQLFSDYCCLTKEQAMEHVESGYVWIDYWSVPQKDIEKQQAYVDSIFVYVQMSSLFIALVPPCQHQDTREMMDISRWEQSGWCRLEAISNVLAERPAPLLVVESLGNRWLGPNRWCIQPVGQGVFTCCQLKHTLPDGQKIRCDKERIGHTLEKLFDFKIKGADEDDDMFTYRLMQCMREHLLGGLPVQRARDQTLVEWMERFRFFAPSACSSTGWTPLRYAVYEGRLDIAAQLLEMDVDLESPLTSDFCKQVFFHREGMTILHGAAMVQNSPEVVRFLIDKTADINRTFGSGLTLAFASAIGSAADNLAALVDAGCPMTGADLLMAVQSDPKLLLVCSQKCPELLGNHDHRDSGFIADLEFAQMAIMWACPSSIVKELRKFEPHERLVDGRLRNLHTCRDEDRRCIFLSHLWLSFEHPDPDGIKCRLLRDLLEKIDSGRMSFPLHWQERCFSGPECVSDEHLQDSVRDGHVWMDYWSVPQRDPESQQQYIDSLGLFVQLSALFVALVPPCQHRETQALLDAKAWEGRGWCRLEFMSHAMSHSPSQYLIVESLGNCWQGSQTMRLIRPPGQGTFTCCQRNHVLANWRSIRCDKERVADVAKGLLERKIEATRGAGDIFTYRLVESLKGHLLAGLPVEAPERETDLARWLQRFRFSSPTGGDEEGGWTPLRYAAYEGRLDIARSLLQAGADIESPLLRDFQKQVCFHQEDVTILQGVCVLRNSPEIVKFLIEHRADMHRTFGNGRFSALFASALFSATGNFEALLDCGCDECEDVGSDLTKVIENSPEIMRVYCQKCCARQ